ncbi:MAG TPA: energy-coupling factor transporter transmembrane protein EcfT [Desulfotomaculum sp.]|nr:energy-coupling factor transporter transmembrane protein EcfT [Desulfotomaculum sp.]
MFEGITLGQYVPGQSFIHRLDPRTKILCAFLAMLAVLVANRPVAIILLTLLTLLFTGLSGLSLRLVAGTLRPFRVILAVTFILQVFFTPGEALLALGPLAVSREGLELGAVILWRLTLLVIISSLLTLTTSPVKLTAGLESLLTPLQRFGVPAHELAMMMTIALRFVPTLLEEAGQVYRAQQSRGAAFTRGGPVRRLQGVIPLLVPLFAGAFRRAEDLTTAMEIRCYRGGANRTRMHQLKFSRNDWLVLLLACLTLAVILALRWWG